MSSQRGPNVTVIGRRWLNLVDLNLRGVVEVDIRTAAEREDIARILEFQLKEYHQIICVEVLTRYFQGDVEVGATVWRGEDGTWPSNAMDEILDAAFADRT